MDYELDGTIKIRQGSEPIAYCFSFGTDVDREFWIKDMLGDVRKFTIHINDEKGITKCKKLKLT